jgi:hypothetical protein
MLIENPLESSELIFPVLEVFHIGAFAIAIGTVALVDFRILNFGLLSMPPSQIARNTWHWTLIGLVVAVFSGLLLFSTDPDMYYTNSSFLAKVVVLIAAISFHYTLHRKVVHSDGHGAGAKVVACVSVLLWILVIFGGILIAFLPHF